MTAAVTNTKSAGSIFSNVAQSLGFAGTVGRTMIVAVWGEGANNMTGLADSASNTYVEDVNNLLLGSIGRRFYRCSNFTGAPTTITIQAPTSVQCYYAVWEVTGMATSSFLNVTTASESEAAATSHSATFTTTANNCIAFCLTGYGGDPGTTSATGSTLMLTHTEYGRDAFYIPDCGAAGAKTITFDTSGHVMGFHLVAAYNIPAGPTVTTVTSSGVTEGGNIAFTVSLSGATSGSTNYGFGVTGTATAGTDYTSPLTSGMCNNSVTVSGGNFVVPTAVSSWTVTIPTTSDTTDEDNETIVLTVGSVASTGGTITDNDAPPVVTFSDGVESFGVVTCTATLDAVSGKDVKFDVSTANGSKTAGTHYTAIVAQTVTIPAGSLTAAITVNTL